MEFCIDANQLMRKLNSHNLFDSLALSQQLCSENPSDCFLLEECLPVVTTTLFAADTLKTCIVSNSQRSFCQFRPARGGPSSNPPMVSRSNGNRTLAFYQSSSYEKQPLLNGTIPDAWMVGGIALIIVVLAVLIVAVRCAVHYLPRIVGYEATSRIEGPGHSLGMYSLDMQVPGKQQGYANLGYLHREIFLCVASCIFTFLSAYGSSM
ncbi:unnamed protein product [Cylicocyclus nassatus]|uniref:Uncharacterized protein n=1 Tax=Cylicocyclus nassatus TaxID=53992 RepID=A0AA36MGQ8_CYLNA|nr:unnamed protein product [Cylicocyclus nassatus]